METLFPIDAQIQKGSWPPHLRWLPCHIFTGQAIHGLISSPAVDLRDDKHGQPVPMPEVQADGGILFESTPVVG
ncbi:MAG: hypothetical protein JWP57_4052 [Spirosoma sp.]|nr:hypothetical protein [Spirosoma sp.]